MACWHFVGKFAAQALPLLLLAGCAHGPHPRPVARRELEPTKIEVVRGEGGVRVLAYDAATLLEQANRDLKAQRYAEAAAGYDRLLREFPDSRHAAPALYNAGLAYEGLRRYTEAAEHYRRLADRQPTGPDARDALFRLGACYAESQHWTESETVFMRLLQRGDLGLSDRLEALSRRGLAQFEQGQLGPAEQTFREALAPFKAHESRKLLDTDFYLAMAQFYLAHIGHRHFRDLPLRLPQRQLEQDVEAKARMFLLVQARYIETIRMQNPVWATAAGYQMGALYKEMYDILLNSPLPPELDTEQKRQVYFAVLKEKLRVLLDKAKRIHEKNIAMAERIGVDNDWVRRSGDQLTELERMLATPDMKPETSIVQQSEGSLSSSPSGPPQGLRSRRGLEYTTCAACKSSSRTKRAPETDGAGLTALPEDSTLSRGGGSPRRPIGPGKILRR